MCVFSVHHRLNMKITGMLSLIVRQTFARARFPCLAFRLVSYCAPSVFMLFHLFVLRRRIPVSLRVDFVCSAREVYVST